MSTPAPCRCLRFPEAMCKNPATQEDLRCDNCREMCHWGLSRNLCSGLCRAGCSRVIIELGDDGEDRVYHV